MSDIQRVHSFLTQPEVQFLDAAVARLIPADKLGPGAKEAGVSYFIDQQLASAWGTAGRTYRQGPWLEGTPQQGNQSPLSPQETYREAIREINLHCRDKLGKLFCFLKPDEQDKVLTELSADKVPLESVSSRAFFNLLWKNTQEGFFADPIYGGNQDKVGWKLVGFPGVAASNYPQDMGKFNEPYAVEPVGIADVVQGRVKVDAQGLPRHVPLKRA